MGKKTHTGKWTRREKKAPEARVLVGFGKHDLSDMMALPEPDKAQMLMTAFVKGWPPRYKYSSACGPEDVSLFRDYVYYLQQNSRRKK